MYFKYILASCSTLLITRTMSVEEVSESGEEMCESEERSWLEIQSNTKYRRMKKCIFAHRSATRDNSWMAGSLATSRSS